MAASKGAESSPWGRTILHYNRRRSSHACDWRAAFWMTGGDFSP
jgi:hypothetical protein